MNDIFSLRRFGLLLKKFTREHILTYLLYVAGMFGILMVVYGFVIVVSLEGGYPDEPGQVFYAGGLLFGSTIFAGSFYSFFNNKAKGIQFLNLPSSHGEKLSLSFLFTQIIFFTTFILVFFLVDRIMGAFYNAFHTLPPDVRPEHLSRYTAVPLDFTNNFSKASLITAITLSSVAHFGSLCFEKSSFIKTAMIVIVVGTGILYLNYSIIKAIIPEESEPSGMFYMNMIRYTVGNETDNRTMMRIVKLPESWDKFIYWFLPGFVYLFFWVASLFKLREKQV
jgi:hypothetical protein